MFLVQHRNFVHPISNTTYLHSIPALFACSIRKFSENSFLFMSARLQKFNASIGVILIVALLARLDWITGYHVSMNAFYALPIFLAVWWIGNPQGFFVALGIAILCFIMRPAMRDAPQLTEGVKLWNGVMRFATFSFFSMALLPSAIKPNPCASASGCSPAYFPSAVAAKKSATSRVIGMISSSTSHEHSDADVAQKLCPDCSAS